mmetsp:Transcript_7779/g.23812  ORF Transcript_7779/g.23812 Transcript_7779/m.23812 type:complete len:334 (-) Transcript_7779:31-1032(-)
MVIIQVLLIISEAGVVRASIDRGDDGVGHALELLELLVDLVGVGVVAVLLKPLERVGHRVLDGLLVRLVELATQLLLVLDLVAQVVGVRLQAVARVDLLLHLLVLLGELLGLLDHAVDLLLAQAALLVGDDDLLLGAGALVLGAHVQNAVGVNLEGHLDLRRAARRRGDVGQVELAQEVAVLGHGALALEDLDLHRLLVVLVRRERLRLLGGDDGVARDELGHHAAHRLDALRERRHVEQQDVLGVALLARQDAALHRRAEGHRLVGVDALVGLLAVEVRLDQVLHLGDARRAANQHDLVHLVLGEARVLHGLLDGAHGLLEQVGVELLEARA